MGAQASNTKQKEKELKSKLYESSLTLKNVSLRDFFIAYVNCPTHHEHKVLIFASVLDTYPLFRLNGAYDQTNLVDWYSLYAYFSARNNKLPDAPHLILYPIEFIDSSIGLSKLLHYTDSLKLQLVLYSKDKEHTSVVNL